MFKKLWQKFLGRPLPISMHPELIQVSQQRKPTFMEYEPILIHFFEFLFYDNLYTVNFYQYYEWFNYDFTQEKENGLRYTTIAELILNLQQSGNHQILLSQAKSWCHPSDVPDFYIGQDEAFKKLIRPFVADFKNALKLGFIFSRKFYVGDLTPPNNFSKLFDNMVDSK